MKWAKIDFTESIDTRILPAVEIVNSHGFDTFESCQSGDGHSFPEPTVRFWGSEAYGVTGRPNIYFFAYLGIISA